jgi:hypothetical protein
MGGNLQRFTQQGLTDKFPGIIAEEDHGQAAVFRAQAQQ